MQIAVAQLERKLLFVGAIMLDRWDEGRIPTGTVRNDNRAFGEVLSGVARTICREKGMNLLVRCSVSSGKIQLAILLSHLTKDDQAETAFRTSISQCADGLKPWGSRPAEVEELEQYLALQTSWSAVHLTKPPYTCDFGHAKVSILSRLSSDHEIWSPLISGNEFWVDFGFFPLTCPNIDDRLNRIGAESKVLGRHVPDRASSMYQNAEAAMVARKQMTFAGMSVTVLGPQTNELASHLAIYENSENSQLRGLIKWQVDGEEMESEKLGFLCVDYSQEANDFEALEPDLVLAFEQAQTIAYSFVETQSTFRHPGKTRPGRKSRPFDVFLSHNSRDKATVRRIADALESMGLRVWLDERELVPGRPWQEAIEDVIQEVRSAAVLVGSDGLGPWEMPEMRACLSECVDRQLPVIPVLLPGASHKPVLPLFLRTFTWVDLRRGLSKDGLDRLVWGITGANPQVTKPKG